jgi:hypothetical protein
MNRKRLILIVAALFAATFGWAQETITIGTGTAESRNLNLGGYWGFAHHATLYASEELVNGNWLEITGGEITKLAFQLAAVVAPNTDREIKIYLKEVSQAELTTSMFADWAALTASATLVYSQTGMDISLTANTWNEFEFSAPFPYSGGNLLVITDTRANYINGGSDTYLYYTSAANKHWVANKDVSAPANNASGEVNDNCANIRLTLTNITGVQATCAKPTELSITADVYSAAISWQGAANAESYTVEYKIASQDWTEATVISNVSQTSTTLTVIPVTIYQIRIKTHCGETDGDSGYSDIFSFTTPCEAVAVGDGFTEDFTSIVDYAVPDCWTKTQPHNPGGPVYPAVASKPDHGKFVRFYGVAPQILTMPEFVEEANMLEVTFDLWRESGASSGVFEVGVLSDPADPATFVSVQNVSSLITVADKTYATYAVSLANVPSGYHYIAFRQSGSTTAYFYQLDNIVVAPLATVPAPMADFTFATDSLTATFTDLSTGSPAAWAWNFGDETTSVEQNPTHTYAQSGTYQVTLIVTGEGGESEPVVKDVACIIPSSINEVLAGKITLYPNPAKDFTCLTISGITGNVSLEITDISGKAVMTDNFYAHNQTIKNVDVNNLGKGIYFVHLQAKNSVIMQKLVVN